MSWIAGSHQKQGEGCGTESCSEPGDRTHTLIPGTLSCERIHFCCVELLDLWQFVQVAP